MKKVFACLLLSCILVSCGEIEVDPPIELETYNYGSEENPLNVDEFIRTTDVFGENVSSSKKVYLLGTVNGDPIIEQNKYSFFILYSEKDIQIKNAQLINDIKIVKNGDTVCVEGHCIHRKSETEDYYCIDQFELKNNTSTPNVYKCITSQDIGGDENPDPVDPIDPITPSIEPLTISQAIEIMNSYADNQFSDKKYYVVGTVKTITHNTKFDSYTVVSAERSDFQFYSFKLNGLSEPNYGDTIVCYGYLKKHVKSGNAPIYEVSYCDPKDDSPILVDLTKI